MKNYPSKHAQMAFILVTCLAIVSTIDFPVVADSGGLKTNGNIAFVSGRDGNLEIYVMNADGSMQTRLTQNPSEDQDPYFSPDGRKIVFWSNRDGDYDIYVMNADGSEQTKLTHNSYSDEQPSWSPDGKKIAFPSNRDGNLEIYVMNADGSEQTRLTHNSYSDEQPRWSPDGTKIAYNTNRDGNMEIYVMNADGSEPMRLTSNPADDWDPCWSPDGLMITFDSIRDGNWNIYSMNANGSGQTRLTDNTAVDWGPVWQSLYLTRTTLHTVNWDGYSFNVTIQSNSTISVFNFSRPEKRLSFNVTTPPFMGGFCNLTLPTDLLGGPYLVSLDGTPIVPIVTGNSTHTGLYFAVPNDGQIEIVGTTAIAEFPSADFESNSTSGPEPFKVGFKDLTISHDGIVFWSWDFGDGSTSTQQHPNHTYNQEGTYTVNLTVKDADNDSDTVTRTAFIAVADTGPTAHLLVAPRSGAEPMTVTFTDMSKSHDGIVFWSWDFGDGSTSTQQHPNHTYNQEGTYTVNLTVKEPDNDTDTETKFDHIVIRDTVPVAEFSADPRAGDEPLEVSFTDLSISYDAIISWSWDFGDGSTSTQQHPNHRYGQNGTYTVTLEVKEQDGSLDLETKNQFVVVNDTGPSADFSVNISGPLTVDFTENTTSYDGVVFWAWNFGDGTTSEQENPRHVYLEKGTFEVTLSVLDFDGSFDSKTITIDIPETFWNSLPILGSWLCVVLFRTDPSRKLWSEEAASPGDS